MGVDSFSGLRISQSLVLHKCALLWMGVDNVSGLRISRSFVLHKCELLWMEVDRNFWAAHLTELCASKCNI